MPGAAGRLGAVAAWALPPQPEPVLPAPAAGFLGHLQVGEVCIRGPNVTKGYKENPKANEEAFAGNLWEGLAGRTLRACPGQWRDVEVQLGVLPMLHCWLRRLVTHR